MSRILRQKAFAVLWSVGGFSEVKESTEKQVWFLLMVAAAVFLIPRSLFFFEIAVWILAILLIAICWWKGEKPRWRWGKD